VDILRNLAHGFSGRDQAQNLILPIGQPFMRKLLDSAAYRQSQGLSNGRADILSAG
jgi:hypothetical protein